MFVTEFVEKTLPHTVTITPKSPYLTISSHVSNTASQNSTILYIY